MASLDFADPTVAQFFSGRNVFITGATGYLGKVLIEKLLRCVPNIGTLYLLIRPSKKQPNVQERLREEVTESMVFDHLRLRQPQFAQKLRAVAGDVGDAGLGLSEKDRNEIQDLVSVILHGAATVKFHEHMQVALNINVNGVRRMVELMRGCRQLQSVVHISTAYVSATRSDDELIDEGIYPLDFDHNALQSRVMAASPEDVESMTPDILHQHGEWPNTYTLTKRIAEVVLLEEGKGLPIVVVRPTIVTCSDKEPFPGWVDTLIGPGGLVLATALGFLHVMPGNPHHIVDFVPVDYVINCIVSCAWFAGTRPVGRAPLRAVHIGTSHKNPVRWGLMMTVLKAFYARHPSEKQAALIHFRWVQSKAMYTFLHYLYHVAPAALSDLANRAVGRKSNNLSKMSRLTGLVETLLFFTTRQWRFDSVNGDVVMAAMCGADRLDFGFDARDIIWDSYFDTFGHGLKKYVLRESVQYSRARL